MRMAQYVRIALRGVVMCCDKHWQIFSTCALSPGVVYSLEVMRPRRNDNIIPTCKEMLESTTDHDLYLWR